MNAKYFLNWYRFLVNEKAKDKCYLFVVFVLGISYLTPEQEGKLREVLAQKHGEVSLFSSPAFTTPGTDEQAGVTKGPIHIPDEQKAFINQNWLVLYVKHCYLQTNILYRVMCTLFIKNLNGLTVLKTKIVGKFLFNDVYCYWQSYFHY